MAKKTDPLRESKEDALDREAFITLFLASRKLTAEVEAVCKEEQVAMSHYVVLWFLVRQGRPEGVPMGKVIDGQLNRATDSTRLADRLLKLDFIERFADPDDRRVVLVRLTPKGRNAYLRITRNIKALHREQWAAFSQGELGELSRLLQKAIGDESAAEKLNTFAKGDQ